MRVRVEYYMSHPVIAALPTDNLARVRNLMLRFRIGHVVISSDDRPQGMISKSDFIKLMYNRRWLLKPLTEILAQDIMSKPVYAVLPSKSVTYAARRMLEKSIGSLVVVKDAASMSIAGIITRTDLLRAFVENYSGLFRVRDYVERDVPTCSPEHSVFYAIEKLASGQPVVVVDRNEVVGVIGGRDLAFLSTLYSAPGKPLRVRGVAPRGFEAVIKVYPAVMVSEIMNSNVMTVKLNGDLAEAAQIMVRCSLDVVPVVDESGALVGAVTKRTVLKALKDSSARRS